MARPFQFSNTGARRLGGVPDARVALALSLVLQFLALTTPYPFLLVYAALPIVGFWAIGMPPHRLVASSRFFLVLITVLIVLRRTDGAVYGLRLISAYFTARLLLHIVPAGRIADACAWLLRPFGTRAAANTQLYINLVLRNIGGLYRSGRRILDGIASRGGRFRKHPVRLLATLAGGLFHDAAHEADRSADALYARGYHGIPAPFPRLSTRARLVSAALFLIATLPAFAAYIVALHMQH